MSIDGRGDDNGLRFGIQDTEWLLSAVDLMLATGLGSSSDLTRNRMKEFRAKLEMQSALPRHSGSYGDAFRFNDAVEAVKSCAAWETRLIVDRSSFFKDVTLAIETYEDGKRRHFKLTSNLFLGPDAPRDTDPMEVFGVYLNRLTAICQEVAPASAKQINEKTVRVLADWRSFYAVDEDKMKPVMGNLLASGIVGPFSVRGIELSPWSVDDGNSLPERLRYLDVTVAATQEGHERLADYVVGYNTEFAANPEAVPSRGR